MYIADKGYKGFLKVEAVKTGETAVGKPSIIDKWKKGIVSKFKIIELNDDDKQWVDEIDNTKHSKSA